MVGAEISAAAVLRPTPSFPLRHIEAVVNAASGSVGPGAGQALQALVEEFGLSVHVAEVGPAQIAQAVAAAAKAGPDLLIVLAGDGTARLAAELCGPEGPLVAPLPGGTMNMLPKALYGTTDWRAALRAALEHGEARVVSGGEVGGKSFYVAAILGAPALWADAREAVRAHKLGLAWTRVQRAFRRAFAGKLRFDLADQRVRRCEALTLMCPLVSPMITTEDALEADALDPHGVAEAFRLGLRAAFGGLFGEWRKDPSVSTELCRKGQAWARGHIPAILDGEPHRFPRRVRFSFRPAAFRALAPHLEPPPTEPAEAVSESVTSVV
jgi:diacylglycerol kinase family enzyme